MAVVERKVSVHTDMDAMMSGLQRSIQRLANLASFGLISAENSTAQTLHLPNVQFQIDLAGNEPPDFEDTKRDFQTWVLAGGLRDGVEAVGSFLEEVRGVCAVFSFGPHARIRGSEWIDRIVKEKKQFHRMGLPDKLDFLKERYEPGLVSKLEGELLSINKARNCLVHRRGVVSELDANSPDGLRVAWLKPQVVIEGKSGQRPVHLPERVEAGDKVVFQQVEASKLFPLGEHVVFNAQEFSEVCWTFYCFGQQLKDGVEQYGRGKGIHFAERQVGEEKPVHSQEKS